MSLIDNMMTDCVIVNKNKVSDGEGGFLTVWEDGAQIKAAIVRDNTMTARVAEQDGMKSVFTVTTSRSNALEFHDVIKRLSDGATFRITSDGTDKESPNISTLDIAQVNAEKWELPR